MSSKIERVSCTKFGSKPKAYGKTRLSYCNFLLRCKISHASEFCKAKLTAFLTIRNLFSQKVKRSDAKFSAHFLHC